MHQVFENHQNNLTEKLYIASLLPIFLMTYLKLCAKKVRLDRLQCYKVRPFSGFQTLWILILLCMYFNLQLDYTRKNFFYCRKRHKKSRLYKSFLFGS